MKYMNVVSLERGGGGGGGEFCVAVCRGRRQRQEVYGLFIHMVREIYSGGAPFLNLMFLSYRHPNFPMLLDITTSSFSLYLLFITLRKKCFLSSYLCLLLPIFVLNPLVAIFLFISKSWSVFILSGPFRNLKIGYHVSL